MKLPSCLALLLLPICTGCMTSGVLPSTNLTNVQLAGENFQVVATNVTGEAEAAYLIGFSGSVGQEITTFALVRLEGNGMLYREAIENLWANFEAEHGEAGGRSLALVNLRYDADAWNILGVYTRPKISVRADVVEFQ
jgi:hypothetical protein